MKYLTDTDILIDHLRGKRYLDPKIIQAGIGMSIISLGELLYGAEKSRSPKKALAEIEALLDLGVVIENLNIEIISVYAKLKVSLEKSGERLDEFDLLIAATARVFELELITRNIRHFSRIKGLKIHEFNPN